MQKTDTPARRTYGKDNPNLIMFRDSKNPMPITKARELLAEVEASRFTRMVKDPTVVSVKDNALLVGKDKVGTLTPHAVFGIVHHTGAKTSIHNPDEKKLNAALRSKDWGELALQVRGIKAGKTITSIMTSRYQHLPYDELLAGFPKGYVVPRLQVDERFVQVHVMEPSSPLIAKDDVFLGGRVLGSDVGLLRATLLLEIMKLVCTNGLIRAEVEAFYRRYHLGREGAPHIREEWKEKVAAFLSSAKEQAAIERKRIEHARGAVVTVARAQEDLRALGLGATRVESAIAYAQREFGERLSRWSVAQGITAVSQYQRGEAALPTSISVANDIDVVAAVYLDPSKHANRAA